MPEVIPFPEPKEPDVWVCECGCEVFYILDNHEAECCDCGNEIDLFDCY